MQHPTAKLIAIKKLEATNIHKFLFCLRDAIKKATIMKAAYNPPKTNIILCSASISPSLFNKAT